jgi:ubiquinone/menaquinone biosynthesis C-methylase UbiE
MGLACGNLAALAALKTGEVVPDLGSGGGFDVFIAVRKVGAAGRAIGVDMTPEMLAEARSREQGGTGLGLSIVKHIVQKPRRQGLGER